MFDGAVKAGAGDVLYYEDRETFLQEWQEEKEELLPADSTILVKASHGMEFEKIVEELEK